MHFVGRLATYKYYNMDQVVAQALALFEAIAARGDGRGDGGPAAPRPTGTRKARLPGAGRAEADGSGGDGDARAAPVLLSDSVDRNGAAIEADDVAPARNGHG